MGFAPIETTTPYHGAPPLFRLQLRLQFGPVHGIRTERGAAVVVEEDRRRRDLDPRHDSRNHSPTGFEWGYSGSGPAQLALALAADVLGDDERAQASRFTPSLPVTTKLHQTLIQGFQKGESAAETGCRPPMG
jgi:hypothetical protein